MNSYRKTLKSITVALDRGEFLFFPNERFSDEHVRFLDAKGLIHLKPYGDDMFYITLDDSGRTFFYDRRMIWINRLCGFIAGILTAVIANLLSDVLPELLPFLP